MCGIFFYIKNLNLEKVKFVVDLFDFYKSNHFAQTHLLPKEDTITLEKHFIEKGLFCDIDIKTVINLLTERGPDYQAALSHIVSSGKIDITMSIENAFYEFEKFSEFSIFAVSSILHLRGKENVPNPQPLVNMNLINYICYNGEIYGIDENSLQELRLMLPQTALKVEQFLPFQNDTIQLFEFLNQFSVEIKQNIKNYAKGLSLLLASLKGDYSLVFADFFNLKINSAKDPFGKRSLLLGFTKNGLVFSSTNVEKQYYSSGLFQQKKSYEEEEKYENDNFVETEKLNEKNKLEYLKQKYYHDYFEAINGQKMIEIPGNTLLTIDLIDLNNIVISGCSINSWFKNLESGNIELMPTLPINHVEVVQKCLFDYINILTKAIINLGSSKSSFSNTDITQSKILVMFSGGLDSTLIARILCMILPKCEDIDLINVSFDKNSFDRKASLNSWKELKILDPDRKINLILCDKSVTDSNEVEEKIVSRMYPRISHMDYNISLVLWAASMGVGYLDEGSGKVTIKSGARIIFGGLGADEFFGGYSRYKMAFQRGGEHEQRLEMLFDVIRLWTRNLGRDDRLISSNSKEIRFPFLDLELFKKSLQLPIELLDDFKKPKGVGDNIILREIAKNLGLQNASLYPKKAIQFGTGLAKLTNIEKYGAHKKAKGNYVFQMAPANEKKLKKKNLNNDN